MPAVAEPPKGATDLSGLTNIPKIDPTPGLGDVTSFEQVKGGKPAEVPKLQPKPEAKQEQKPAKPAQVQEKPGAKEIVLDKTGHERPDQMPDEIAEELEALAGGTKEDTKEKPAPKARSEEDNTKDETTSDETSASDAPVASDDDAELETKVQSYKVLKDLRTAHKEALKREKAWRKEEAAAKEKLAAHEAKLAALAKVEEQSKAATTELEAARKRAEDLENKVKLLDYKESAEFHDKHVKPLARALEDAHKDIKELQVENEDGTKRQATPEDFKLLLQLSTQQAGELAEKLFGRYAAGEMLAHRRAVLKLRGEQREALENAGKAAEEFRTRTTLEATKRLERVASVYKQRAEEIETAHPQLFKARDGDEQGNELLQKGHEWVGALDDPEIPEETRVKIAAEVKYRAAGFGRLLLDYQRLQRELSEAHKKLKGFEGSEPGEGALPTEGRAGTEQVDPLEASLREIDKMAGPMR